MLANVVLGSNDLDRAAAFHDGLLALFGARQVMRNARSILWKPGDAGSGIAVCLPHDGQAATHGNGTMVGLKAGSTREVDLVHQTALRLGGTCEGPPGERRPDVYAAYFRDPDGNKFGVFHVAGAG
ncbi:VOC family protein [Luteimonas viscosa]|uniref:VOC family protein n=1 Tax=Luteimonas viscosa TaxID=1132694 RepID=A0A5D4XS01_9GAMM|nr:VOC family protein [Luteimonas viscosa]TYT26713.1 VOC family protein [Luteimonas viscosa]